MRKTMFYFRKRHRSVILAVVILLIIGIVIVQARPPGHGALNVESRNIGAHVLDNLEGVDLKVPEGDGGVKDFDQIPENDLINGQMHIEARHAEDKEDSKEAAIGHGRPMELEEEEHKKEDAKKTEDNETEIEKIVGRIEEKKQQAVKHEGERSEDNKNEDKKNEDKKNEDKKNEDKKNEDKMSEDKKNQDKMSDHEKNKDTKDEDKISEDKKNEVKKNEDKKSEDKTSEDKTKEEEKSEEIPTKLALDKLQPPDHLDGVRLEQDGHLNRDYKKEILLGNHEDIDNGSEEQMHDKLKEVFHKVDTDKDGFVSIEELEKWIQLRIQEHFKEADAENEIIFKQLDMDKDGLITWKEFHVQFLQAKGFKKEDSEKHVEDYDTIPLDGDVKEQIIKHKFRWADADEEPQDNALSLKEFQSFRHPEQSSNMLGRMVRDILDNLDKDGDSVLTEEEFTALPPGEVDERWREVDMAWQDERRKEFQKVIDLDKDGKVTKEELKSYVDPKNPSHASLEAKNLIQLADMNRDDQLSLSEVLENAELFLGSKMVNTGRSFHDEF